jgi:hypothetical protein
MKKRTLLLALAVILLASCVSPVGIQAQNGNADVTVLVDMDFPLSLTFNISSKSTTQITDIRLHYTVDFVKFAEVVSEEVVSFTPSKNVSTQYIMDMRQTGGLPPGSGLTYWLTVTDTTGSVTETLPQKIIFNDERYSWKSLQQGMVTLYWYEGNDAFGKDLMDAIQQSLGRLSEDSGAELENPVNLYIYASSSDLIGALVFAQDWTGGVAFTEYGIIAIGIGTSKSSIEWGKGAISHELTHLVVHQVTSNPYNNIPPWLDEGLAMNSEGPLDAQFSGALAVAEADNTLISVRSLSSPFSAYASEAILAYAESYEIVRFLIDNYGRDKMFELLSIFKQGSGYDEALQTVYGFDMASLNTRWQAAAMTVIAP